MKQLSERSLLLLVAAVQFTHVMAFMIMTLTVPASRRGAFMSLSGCARDLAMGLASGIAGWLVTTAPSGELVNFHWLGWIAVMAGAVSIWLATHVRVHESDSGAPAPDPLVRPALAPATNNLLVELQVYPTALIENQTPTCEKLGEGRIGPELKAAFGGAYIANEKFTRETGNQVLAAGEADAVAFGVPFISNPDLPERLRRNASLNPPDQSTFYAPGPKGYTDYPFLPER